MNTFARSVPAAIRSARRRDGGRVSEVDGQDDGGAAGITEAAGNTVEVSLPQASRATAAPAWPSAEGTGLGEDHPSRDRKGKQHQHEHLGPCGSDPGDPVAIRGMFARWSHCRPTVGGVRQAGH